MSFKWEGNFVDDTPCDKYHRKLVHIVAIDALPFRNPYMQFDEQLIRRDVNKAYCGFYHDPSIEHSGMPVSGGFWGCGAFGGFHKLKCLIQLIACVANRRNLVFYTFGDDLLVEEMHNMFSFLSENDISVAQLWRYLIIFRSQSKKFEEFYQSIYDQHMTNHLLEGLVYQSDSFTLSEEVVEREQTSEKRRSNEDSITESNLTQESYLNYTESDDIVENPSKRTKTDDGDGMCYKIIESIQESDDKSDIGSEVEITDKFEQLSDEDNLQEIVIVTDTPDVQEIQDVCESNMECETRSDAIIEDSSDMMSEDVVTDSVVMDQNNCGPTDSTENKAPQKKTILDYFKPKTSDS